MSQEDFEQLSQYSTPYYGGPIITKSKGRKANPYWSLRKFQRKEKEHPIVEVFPRKIEKFNPEEYQKQCQRAEERNIGH